MASFNIEINSKPNKDGLHSLFVRFTENRKNKRVMLDFRIPFQHFNKKARYGKWIRATNPHHDAYNLKITKAIDELKVKYHKLKLTHDITLDHITTKEIPVPGTSLKVYSERYLKHIEADSSIGYYRHVKSTITRFIIFFDKDINISDFNPDLISKYRSHLLHTSVSGTTVNDNMKRIYAMFKAALNDDTILKDPFRVYKKARTVLPNRIKLSDEQIEKLQSLDLPLDGKKNRLHNTRNYFLFSYYNAGIRVGDLMQLRIENISNGRLEYEMDKTGHKKSIPLISRSLDIINEYLKPESKSTDYLFPILDSAEPYSKFISYSNKRKMDKSLRERLYQQISSKTTMINTDLAIISKKLGFPKVSFHVARHSFADKARRSMKTSNKITVFDIMYALGHKRVTTTQGYLNNFDTESLDEAMEDIFA